MTKKFLTPVVLPGPPSNPLEAATKQYVDDNAGGGSAGIVVDNVAPADTAVLWADTTQVGIEENYRLLSTSAATAYTLGLTDRGKLLLFTSASAVTLTVPTNVVAAFLIGTQLDIVRYGTGSLTVTQSGGVTVNATPTKILRAQYSSASLIKINTDEWLLLGDLSS